MNAHGAIPALPLDGTPRPPDPAAGAPGPDQSPPPTPSNLVTPTPLADAAPAQSPGAPAPVVAPSSYDTAELGPGPSVAVVKYDPRTGAYMGPDGHMYDQTDLASTSHQRSWTDLVYSP